MPSATKTQVDLARICELKVRLAAAAQQMAWLRPVHASVQGGTHSSSHGTSEHSVACMTATQVSPLQSSVQTLAQECARV
jgi:hypothetical protein